MLLAMRQFRCGLVQTPQQFRFAYLAILTGLHDKFPSLFSDAPKEIGKISHNFDFIFFDSFLIRGFVFEDLEVSPFDTT